MHRLLQIAWYGVLAVGLWVGGRGGLLQAQGYLPPAGLRQNIGLDANWRFIRQDITGAQAAQVSVSVSVKD